MKHIKNLNNFINESDENDPSGISGLKLAIRKHRDFRKRVDDIREEMMDIFMDFKDDGLSVIISSDKTSWIDWDKADIDFYWKGSLPSDKIGNYIKDEGFCVTIGIHPTGDNTILIDDAFINILKFAESYTKKELGLEIGQIYIDNPPSYRYYKSIDVIPRVDVDGIELSFRFIKEFIK